MHFGESITDERTNHRIIPLISLSILAIVSYNREKIQREEGERDDYHQIKVVAMVFKRKRSIHIKRLAHLPKSDGGNISQISPFMQDANKAFLL